jgi:hypothetical protein
MRKYARAQEAACPAMSDVVFHDSRSRKKSVNDDGFDEYWSSLPPERRHFPVSTAVIRGQVLAHLPDGELGMMSQHFNKIFQT